MKPKPLNPAALSRPVGYSHGVRADSRGRLLFVGGQVGWDRDERMAEDEGKGVFAAQFARALDNFLAVVREAGGEPGNVTQMRIYVVDRREYASSRREIGVVWRERMGRWFPAMTLVEVAGLLEEGARVEIDGVAVL